MKEISIRSMIVAPRDHVLVSWDLKQAESWVVAYLANEPNMKRSLTESDIHLETASEAFFPVWNTPKEAITKAQRYTAKRFNHATSYRMGHRRAAQVINQDSDKPPYVVITFKESKELYDAWHSYYHLQSWWSDIESQLQRTRTLITPYGRIRTFFASWGDELFKEATAYVPQSTVADHFNGKVQKELGISGGLIEVYKQFAKPGTIKIINQSHDSLIAEVHKDVYGEILPQVTALIRRPLIVNGEQFTIPVDCEIGERWGELTPFKEN
jgi:DNA polymerase I-like protein with 3'-5' exonuclease and polymerase domains